MSINIKIDIRIVGKVSINIFKSIFGVDDIFTIKTVGMKSSIAEKYAVFINKGMNSTNVAKTSTIVIAELASFVLSTYMDNSVPIPINAKPIKNRVINIKTGL